MGEKPHQLDLQGSGVVGWVLSFFSASVAESFKLLFPATLLTGEMDRSHKHKAPSTKR